MFQKFWKKRSEGEENRVEKLPGPKNIPDAVGRYLVVDLDKDPDWVWNLKVVLRGHPESKDVFDFRVYNEMQLSGKGIRIKNYTSFDTAPELILYQGWFNKRTNEVHVEEKPITEKAA